MNRMIDSKAQRLCYSAFFILVLSTLAIAQVRQRVVDWHPQAIQGNFKAGGCGVLFPTEISALEVVEIMAADTPIVLGQAFDANEDWLKTLLVKVKNVSGKPISFVRTGFYLPEAKNDKGTMGFSLIYGEEFSNSDTDNKPQKVILPGQEVILARREIQSHLELIRQRSGKTDFSKVLIGLTMVKFEDGTTWSSRKLPISGQKSSVGKKAAFTERNGHRVSGTVTMKPDEQAVVKAKVEIRNISVKPAGAVPFQDCIYTDSQGRWTIENVPDGEYLIIVAPPHRPSLASQKDEKTDEANSVAKEFVAKTYEVKMAGNDITDLALKVNRGGIISGRVTMDGGVPFPENLVVLPEQTAESGRSPAKMAQVEPDGSFTLTGVPTGKIRLRVFVYGKSNEYRMKSASVNGADLLSETLEIEDGTEIKNVRILFARTLER